MKNDEARAVAVFMIAGRGDHAHSAALGHAGRLTETGETALAAFWMEIAHEVACLQERRPA